MRKVLLFFCFLPVSVCCLGQSPKQLKQCRQILAKDPETILSPDICTLIASGLSKDEEVASIFDNGSFMTLTPDGVLREKHLPPAVQSSLLLKSLTRTIQTAEIVTLQHPNGMTAALLPGAREYWMNVRDAYCSYHPDDPYTDLQGKEHVCKNQTVTGNPNFPEDLLRGVAVLQFNFQNAQ